MADQRTTDEAIAAVLAAAEHLELPVTVEYDRAERRRTYSAQARLVDDDGFCLAKLVEMDCPADDATDPQAEAIATILNDAPLLAAELRDLHASRDGEIARALEEVDSSVARYINRDLARDALHVLEALETLGSPANEETIHHVKVVCADGEIRSAMDAIAGLLPRLRSAAELGAATTDDDGALARVLATADAQALSLDQETDRQRLIELVAAARPAATAPGCDLCGDNSQPTYLRARCHLTAPLRAELAAGVLTLYCYVPECGRVVARLPLRVEGP